MSSYEVHFVPLSDIIRLYDICQAHFPVMLPFRGLPFQKMIHLSGIRFALFHIKKTEKQYRGKRGPLETQKER